MTKVFGTRRDGRKISGWKSEFAKTIENDGGLYIDFGYNKIYLNGMRHLPAMDVLEFDEDYCFYSFYTPMEGRLIYVSVNSRKMEATLYCWVEDEDGRNDLV